MLLALNKCFSVEVERNADIPKEPLHFVDVISEVEKAWWKTGKNYIQVDITVSSQLTW